MSKSELPESDSDENDVVELWSGFVAAAGCNDNIGRGVFRCGPVGGVHGVDVGVIGCVHRGMTGCVSATKLSGVASPPANNKSRRPSGQR